MTSQQSNICLCLAATLVGIICTLVTQVASAEMKVENNSQKTSILNEDALNQKIRQLGEFEIPLTSAQHLLAQSPTPQTIPTPTIQITGVKANPTSKGIEVILETSVGTQLQVTNRSTGNNFIVDVSGGQLRLASGEAFTFRSEKPLAGITEITVTNINANTVRVTVVGEKALPTVELFDDDPGLVFAVASSATTTSPQQPPQAIQPESETQPTQPSASGDEPIELVVTGEQDGYRVSKTRIFRTDTDPRDIPASIQVVPRQVLQDQRAVRIQDAVQNVSGITLRGNFAGANSGGGYIIRGFAQDGNFRNGFRDNDYNTLSEIANVERVEVLKGPASVLFGQAEPGGIINLVTKQPLSEPYYAADFTVGSYDFYRPTLDFSGPLNSDKTLLYRLNVAYQNSGSFRDFQDTERIFIAPSLTWNIDSKTTLTFDSEYLYNDGGFDTGVVALGNRPARIPISRFLGIPQSNDFQQTNYRGGYIFEHRFSENWQLRNALSITSNNAHTRSSAPSRLLSNNGLFRAVANDAEFANDQYSLQTEITGNFATGSITYRPLLGVELYRTSGFFKYRSANLPNIDIFNPVYDSVVLNYSSYIINSRGNTDTIGVYLQDQITLLDNLKLLVGGRFDFSDQKSDDLLTGTITSQSDQAFSPRVGIVYQPILPISLYASYSRSFVPVTGTSADGSAFEPQRGTQYEVGIKADLNDRLSVTLAAYEITKTNILTASDIPNVSIQVGEQRSRGVELDVAGEILTGWKIIASYAHTNAEITRDNQFPVGNLLNNVAKNTASLWTTYEIQRGSLQGLGFGLGLYYVGDRQGDLANSYLLPSYFRTDAALYYKRNNWRAAINIKNLFNEKYYETGPNRNQITPGAPLTVLGTISWEF